MAGDGYFPRGNSVLRRVHEERAVGLFYGQRALCIGALSPLNFVGTIEHSTGRLRPFRRLAHTAIDFERVFFGERAEADAVLARVRRLHERVRGELPVDCGVHAAGTPYSAFDPELMLWTLAVIADSAKYFYELFVRRLSSFERDALWDDYVRFGELFGMPRSAAPGSWQEFRAWWRAKLASDELFLTDEARIVGYATAFEIPLPAIHQPFKRVHDLIMLGSLPARVRDIYGLRIGPWEQVAFRTVVGAVRAARVSAPEPLARGSSVRSYKLVAETERWRIEHGRPTPQVGA